MTTTAATRPRVGWGVAAALVLLAVVAVPALSTLFLAWSGFTGCSLECTQPDVGTGAAWAAVTAVLLALPAVGGVLVTRVRPRIAVLLVGAMMAGVVGLGFLVRLI